ncbi:MAG: lactate utilization protein [Desulfobacterales bacterium]|nr:MAG: lactate utilization protein [Desulfobacterales bacterium]
MNESILEQFRLKHESLAGNVHLVSGTSEAAEKVVSILQEKEARNVALSDLPDEFRQALEQRCSGAGMNVLKPPFNHAELPGALDAIQAGITWAAFAIAETGAIVEFTTDDSQRLVSALPLVHVAVVRAADMITTLKEAAVPIRNFYQENPLNANVSFISGPSRTADIEMRLILGVHGPAETHAIIIN